MNLRRLSKMVLGGYGGASLLFFGVPYPGQQPTPQIKKSAEAKGEAPKVSPDINMAQEGEEALSQLIHDADDEEITAGSSALPHSRDVTAHSRYPTYQSHTSTTPIHSRIFSAPYSPTPAPSSRMGSYPNSPGPRAGGVPFPSISATSPSPMPTVTYSAITSPTESISGAQGEGPITQAPPIPSWWEILTGQKDQEIFEGFASAAIAAGEIKEGAKDARKELKRGQDCHPYHAGSCFKLLIYYRE